MKKRWNVSAIEGRLSEEMTQSITSSPPESEVLLDFYTW